MRARARAFVIVTGFLVIELNCFNSATSHKDSYSLTNLYFADRRLGLSLYDTLK